MQGRAAGRLLPPTDSLASQRTLRFRRRAVGCDQRSNTSRSLLLPAQRQVFTLRDIEEVGAADVCELLGLSDGNQRVLLHRARSRVRRILEVTIGED